MTSSENYITVKDIKETILSLKMLAIQKSDENNLKTSDLEKLKNQIIEVKVEVDLLQKRSTSLEKDNNMSNLNLEQIETQIDNFGKLADENERWRKDYEKKQLDTDERLDEMTSIIKVAYASTESASNKYDEAIERFHQTKENVSQLERKIEETKKRISQREKEVKERIVAYKQLQCKSEEKSEKELKKEQYITFLRKQVEEAELRAQKAEAEVSLKQEDVERLKSKLKTENDSVGTLRKDMVSICSEFKKL